MKIHWKSITAGMIIIICSIATLVTRIILHFRVSWSTDVLLWLAFVLGFISVSCGYCALSRKSRGCGFIGAVFIMFLWFEGVVTAISWEYAFAGDIYIMLFMAEVPLVLVSVVLLALSKREFT